MMASAALHFLKFLVLIESPETQTSFNERECIYKYAQGKDLAVEIGVFEGVNTNTIAKAMTKKGVLFGIDPFFKGKLGICYHEWITYVYLFFNSNLKKVQFIKKLSFETVNDIPENIEFIFIDGDHTYEVIKKDWELFSKKVKIGGIIALHDTTVPIFDPSRNKLGSIQCFEDFISKDTNFEIIETVDSMNILKRIA